MVRGLVLTSLLLTSCSEVCIVPLKCDLLLIVHVRDARGRPVYAFRGTVDADGTVVDVECPGSQVVQCGEGDFSISGNPQDVSIQLQSIDAIAHGTLDTRPAYSIPDDCTGGCPRGEISVVLK